MKSLFKETCVECFLDSEARVLYHIWNSKPTSPQFRDGLTKVFHEYQKHKTQFDTPLHWLADTRSMGVLNLDDQGWLQKVWNDMLFNKAGVKSHAVIIGNDVFAKYAMEKFKTSMQELYADKK